MQPSIDFITAVVPLKINARRSISDLDRFLRFLLRSFEKFWQGDESIKFLIVAPRGDVKTIERALRSRQRFDIKVISEDSICPSVSRYKGWYKQQLVKLAAARAIESAHYLTLDTDIVLAKPLSLSQLFPNGKPIFQRNEAGAHSEWWQASARILKCNNPMTATTSVMDVTPAILFRDVTLRLLSEIAQRNGANDVDRYLMRNTSIGWTEYSLYWLFVVEQDLAELYDWTVVPLYKGIWAPEQLQWLDMEFMKRAFNEDPEFFLTIQSNLELSLETLTVLLSPFIEVPIKNDRLDLDGAAQALTLRRLMRDFLRRMRRD